MISQQWTGKNVQVRGCGQFEILSGSEQILKHLSWLPVGAPICEPGCCRLYYKRGIVTAD